MRQDACWGNEPEPSITAIGEGLLALDKELADLIDADERLMARRRLIHTKMKICRDAMRDLFDKSRYTYTAREWPRYPELTIED